MRAAVVIVDGGSITLIERIRGDRRYYLFPGGQVELGESSEEAVRREAHDELGLDVEVVRLFARTIFDGGEQRYSIGRVVGGTFGTGAGAEMGSAPSSREGSYRAIRWPVASLSAIDVRPAELSALVQRAAASGWPAEVADLGG